MYANTLAMAYAMEPPSSSNMRRTLFATLAFATGAIVGWPFALAVAVPFVFEELFLTGTDKVTAETRPSWVVGRLQRMLTCGGVAALLLVCIASVVIRTCTHIACSAAPCHCSRHPVLRQADHRAVEHR